MIVSRRVLSPLLAVSLGDGRGGSVIPGSLHALRALFVTLSSVLAPSSTRTSRTYTYTYTDIC